MELKPPTVSSLVQYKDSFRKISPAKVAVGYNRYLEDSVDFRVPSSSSYSTCSFNGSCKNKISRQRDHQPQNNSTVSNVYCHVVQDPLYQPFSTDSSTSFTVTRITEIDSSSSTSKNLMKENEEGNNHENDDLSDDAVSSAFQRKEREATLSSFLQQPFYNNCSLPKKRNDKDNMMSMTMMMTQDDKKRRKGTEREEHFTQRSSAANSTCFLQANEEKCSTEQLLLFSNHLHPHRRLCRHSIDGAFDSSCRCPTFTQEDLFTKEHHSKTCREDEEIPRITTRTSRSRTTTRNPHQHDQPLVMQHPLLPSNCHERGSVIMNQVQETSRQEKGRSHSLHPLEFTSCSRKVLDVKKDDKEENARHPDNRRDFTSLLSSNVPVVPYSCCSANNTLPTNCSTSSSQECHYHAHQSSCLDDQHYSSRETHHHPLSVSHQRLENNIVNVNYNFYPPSSSIRSHAEDVLSQHQLISQSLRKGLLMRSPVKERSLSECRGQLTTCDLPSPGFQAAHQDKESPSPSSPRKERDADGNSIEMEWDDYDQTQVKDDKDDFEDVFD